jgi:hypothetical protein
MQRWPDHIEQLHAALLKVHKQSYIFRMKDGSYIAYGGDSRVDVEPLFTVAELVKYTSRKFDGIYVSEYGRFYRK